MEKLIAQWDFEPKLESSSELRAFLTTKLQEIDVPLAVVENFQLAVTELVVNLCRYPITRAENAQLKLMLSASHISLEILDDGASFRNFSQHIHSTEPLSAGENGMGLKLLDSLFDDLFYVPACYRDDGMNLMAVRQYTGTLPQQKKASILIVDDDAVYRSLISAYLKDDYQTIQAKGVSQAYELLLRHQPELVICDINMPEQDGPALFDQLRHVPSVAGTAFIYLSGCQDVDRIRRALARPIDAFIEKPVTKKQLLGWVSKTLSRRFYLSDQMEKELYQRVTLGLQPHLPKKIEGFDCALRYANPEAGGGDFVLLHQSQLIIADLMGHGVKAKSYVDLYIT